MTTEGTTLVSGPSADPSRGGGGRPAGPRLPALHRVLTDQFVYQARLLVRTPRASMMAFVLPVVLLYVRHTASGGMPAAYRDQTVGGVIAFSVMSTAFQTHASGLVAARELGVLKRLSGTPLPRWCYFAGRIGATCALAVLGTAASLAAAVTLGALSVDVPTACAAVAVAAAAALVWAAVGTAVTAWIPSVEAAAPMLSLAMIPLLFFSGLFFPVSDEPSWLARLAECLPAQPFADAVAHALSGGPSGVPARDALALASWGVAGAATALLGFRWSPYPVGGGRGRREATGT